MAAPMSVKERIAMMKLKEEEEKAKTKTPEPPVRRSSIADKFPGVKTAVTPDSLVNSRVTAAEEIALMKKTIPTEEAGSNVHVISGPSNKMVPPSPPPSDNSENTTSYSTPPPPPPPSQRNSLAGVGPVTDGEPPALSIAGRMAALRNNQNINNATSPPPPPPPAGAARRSSMPAGPVSGDMGLSVAERMAAMKTGNQPAPPPPPASVKLPNPPVPNSGAGVAPPPPPRPTTALPPQPPQPNAVSSPPPGPPVPPPPAPRVMPPVPPPAPSSAPATPATISNGDNEAHNLERTPSVKMTIAERMAALSSPSAVSGSTSTQSTPGSTASRRVSVGLAGLGAKINLSALSPNAVRPPITPKRDTAPEEAEDETPGAKASRVSFTATAEDGEFRHLNLSRPAVPSVRRKQATASVRLQANVWDTADLASALGGSVATPSSTGTGTPRPSSLSSACTAPLPESDTSNTSLEAEADGDIGSESQGRAIEEPIGTNDGATEPEAEETRVRTSLPIDRSNRASLL